LGKEENGQKGIAKSAKRASAQEDERWGVAKRSVLS
jgi:hypothetical protein|tara:strand:+ start:3230 stop:3337 length:108 start_codon:yes stop_codon:yes gene_type:complete